MHVRTSGSALGIREHTSLELSGINSSVYSISPVSAFELLMVMLVAKRKCRGATLQHGQHTAQLHPDHR